jgi:hypothetical protein
VSRLGQASELDLDVANALVDHWRDACEQKQWIAWDIEVVWDHAHLFLGLRPTDAPGEFDYLSVADGRVILIPRLLSITYSTADLVDMDI